MRVRIYTVALELAAEVLKRFALLLVGLLLLATCYRLLLDALALFLGGAL